MASALSASTAAPPSDISWETHQLLPGSNEADTARLLGTLAARLRRRVPVKLDLQQQELNCSSRAVAKALGQLLLGGSDTSPSADRDFMLCNGRLNLCGTPALLVTARTWFSHLDIVCRPYTAPHLPSTAYFLFQLSAQPGQPAQLQLSHCKFTCTHPAGNPTPRLGAVIASGRGSSLTMDHCSFHELHTVAHVDRGAEAKLSSCYAQLQTRQCGPRDECSASVVEVMHAGTRMMASHCTIEVTYSQPVDLPAFMCVDSAQLELSHCTVEFAPPQGVSQMSQISRAASGRMDVYGVAAGGGPIRAGSDPVTVRMSDCSFSMRGAAAGSRAVGGKAAVFNGGSRLEATSCTFTGFGLEINTRLGAHLTDCTIQDCIPGSTAHGFGLYLDSGNAVLERCSILSCREGIMVCSDPACSSQSLQLRGCTISVSGKAVFSIANAAQLDIRHTVMRDCAAGITMHQGRLKMDHSVVVVNSAGATEVARAGVSLSGRSTAVLDECLFLLCTPEDSIGLAFGCAAKLTAMRSTVLLVKSGADATLVGYAPVDNAHLLATGTVNLSWCELANGLAGFHLPITGMSTRLHSCAVTGTHMLIFLTGQPGAAHSDIHMDGCFLNTRSSSCFQQVLRRGAPDLNLQLLEPEDASGWAAVQSQLRGVQITESNPAASVEAALGARRSVAGRLAAAALQHVSTLDAARPAIDGLIGQLRESGWLQPGSATAATAATATSQPQPGSSDAGASTSQASGASGSVEAAMSQLGLGTGGEVGQEEEEEGEEEEGEGEEGQGGASTSREQGGDGSQGRRPVRVCAVCGASPPSGLKRCRGCKGVRYCGSECQTQHWPQHKNECKRLRQERDQRRQAAG